MGGDGVIQWWIILTSVTEFYTAEFMCTKYGNMKSLQDNTKKTGAAFLSIDSLQFMQCVQLCRSMSICESINYINTGVTGYCELNYYSVGNVIAVSNTVFLLMNDLPENNSFRCTNESCESDEACHYNETGGNTVCDQCTNAICGTCFPRTDIGGRAFRSYGCFHSSVPHVLPTMTANFRSSINWSSMRETILKCAHAANSTGKDYFGIEYFGECYVGNFDESTFTSPVNLNDCAANCWASVGQAFVMFVYQWL